MSTDNFKVCGVCNELKNIDKYNIASIFCDTCMHTKPGANIVDNYGRLIATKKNCLKCCQSKYIKTQFIIGADICKQCDKFKVRLPRIRCKVCTRSRLTKFYSINVDICEDCLSDDRE